MSKSLGFMMFVAGATIGSIVTWQYTKKKYEQIAQEEIDSVKEAFSNKSEEAPTRIISDSEVQKKAHQAKEKLSISEYAARLQESGYTNYSEIETTPNKEVLASMGRPYVISPEEFGETDDYEKISLSYYADQVLADDEDELVDDVEDTVGFDSLTHFGDYEEDSVFVRNDRLKCDYEILMDQRNYSDVVNKKPHQVED